MKAAFSLRPAALQDLNDQAQHLASADRRLALRFLASAESTFALLATQPRMGKLCQFRSPHLAGMRIFPLQDFPKHLVFFRPLNVGIEIVRVFHGARDLQALFDPPTP